jgi:hypothetical protein
MKVSHKRPEKTSLHEQYLQIDSESYGNYKRALTIHAHGFGLQHTVKIGKTGITTRENTRSYYTEMFVASMSSSIR